MTAGAEESMTLPDCILSRFPDRKDTIKAFYEHSPTFREICDDYEEISTFLENNSPPEEKSSAMHHHASELLKELEDELMDCLEGRNAPVAMESHNRVGRA